MESDEHNYDLVIGKGMSGWDNGTPFGLSSADRRHHLYVIGKTGTGKSTLFRELICQDIEAGEGLCFIDPHGDEAFRILDHIPPHRTDDVVFIDVGDPTDPAKINPFYRVPEARRATTALDLTHASKHLWVHTGWGDRLEYILFNLFYAVLECPDELRPSFRLVLQVMSDKNVREEVLRHVKDERVREVLEDEFGKWNDRFQAEAFSPAQNKIGSFVAHPNVRRMLSTWRPNVDIEKIMNERKILIVRLSKGAVGAKSANLFGSVLTSTIFTNAMARESIPEEERVDFRFFLDEFQNTSTGAFMDIVAEARKYALSLAVGHQHLAQLHNTPGLQEAIFGNIGTILSFRVGNADAQVLAAHIGEYPAQTFADLDRGEMCVQLHQKGESRTPFLGKAIQSARAPYGRGKIIISEYRRRRDVRGVRRRQRGKRRRYYPPRIKGA